MKMLSLSPGSQCPECVEKRRRMKGTLDADMSTGFLVCSHCGNSFTQGGKKIPR